MRASRCNHLIYLLLAAVAIFSPVCVAQSAVATPVERAQQFFDAGRLQAAMVELKNALLANSDDAQARMLLGRVELRLGEAEAAEKELRFSRSLGAPEELVLPLLAEAYLTAGRPTDVIGIDAGTIPTAAKAQVDAIKAIAYIQLGELDRAHERIVAATAGGEDLGYLAMASAYYSLAKGASSTAKETLSALLERQPGFGLGWSLLGQLLVEEGEMEAAESAYDKAIASRDNKVIDLINRARLRLALGKLDEAQADVDVLRKAGRRFPEIDFIAGVLELKRGNNERGTALLEKANAADSTPTTELFLAAAYLEAGRAESARTLLDRYLAKFPDDPQARTMMAQIKLHAGEPEGAAELLEPILAQGAQTKEVSVIMARSLIGQGKVEEGVSLLEHAAQMDPRSAQARTALGLAKSAAGDGAGAIADLTAALEIDPTYRPAMPPLVFALVGQKDFAAARDVALRYRKAYPDDVQGPLLVGTVEWEAEELERANEAFNEANRLDPGNITANVGLGAIALKNRDFGAAERHYLDALAVHPGVLQLLINLSTVQFEQKRPDEAANTLKTAIEANPESKAPRVMLARQYIVEGDLDQAQRVLSKLVEHHPTDAVSIFLLAETEYEMGRYEDALPHYEWLLLRKPDDPKLVDRLSSIYERLGRVDEYHKVVEQAIAGSPDPERARVAVAYRDLSRGRIAEANAHLTKLQDALEEKNTKVDPAIRTEVQRLDARVAEAEQDWERAARGFALVLDRRNNGGDLLRLANAKWEAGERDSAIDALRGWLDRHPDDRIVRLDLANRYLALGQNDSARREYEAVINDKAGLVDVLAINNLAWLLKDEDPKRAAELARRALALAPKSAPIADTLIVALLASRQLDEASQQIQAALASHPGNPTFLFRRAQLLEASGDQTRARRVLAELLLTDRAFPERGQARELLGKLGGP